MKQSVDVTDVRGSGRSEGAGDVVGLGWARIGSEKSEKHQQARRAVFMYALRLAAQNGTWSTWNAPRPFSALGSCF